MKLKKTYTSVAAIAALAFTGSALAHHIDVHDGFKSKSENEPGLFTIANDPAYGTDGKGMFTDLDKKSHQSNHAYWTTGGNDDTTVRLRATWTAHYKDGVDFGVYNPHDSSTRLSLLGAGDQDGRADKEFAVLTYKDGGNFSVLGGDSANFGGNKYGFFLTMNGHTFYSDPSLNDDDPDHANGPYRMVGYQGGADGGNGKLDSGEYLLGWDDGTNGDYQDYLVSIESGDPASVAEPSSLAMFGVGLLMIGFSARRFKKRGS